MRLVSQARLATAPSGVGFVVCMFPANRDAETALHRIIAAMQCDFGGVSDVSSPLDRWRAPWQYRQEIGEVLRNIVVILEKPVGLFDLVHLKDWTMAVERATRRGMQRTVNLNPGIVLPDRVIAVSHKPRGRIRRYLGARCWAQTVAVRCRGGEFRASLNSFSEYADPTRLALFSCLSEHAMPPEEVMGRGWPRYEAAHNKALHLTVACGARR